MATSRRQTGAKGRAEIEARFKLLAENVVDYAIFMLDETGHVMTWSAGGERIKGYRPEEIIGRHFSVFYPPEDVQSGKPESELEEAAAAGRMEDEGWRVRKDGTRFRASVVITALRDESGVLRGFGKVTRDVTELKRAEAELRNEVAERRRVERELKELNQTLEQRVAERIADLRTSNAALHTEQVVRERAESDLNTVRQRLAGIIDSAMDAIITIDQKQEVLLFNAAAETLFGCPQGEAIGASLSRFIPARFRVDHTGHVEHFGRTGITSRRMGSQRIVMGLRSNGEEFPIEASISHVEQGGKKFYTVILRDVSERVLAEKQLRESREDLHQLASTAQAAREQEKGRLARELHDELGQLITSLKIDLSFLKSDSPSPSQGAKIGAMEGLLDAMVAASRRIASDLRPLMLDDLGLVPAAEWLVQNFQQRTGIDCDFTVDPLDLDLHDPYATAIYRILQESLTNVAKHAQATVVEVSIELDNDEIVLTIRDNGRGFQSTAPRKPTSFGLIGLRERAYFLGGTVVVESEPGKGTTICARIPAASSGGPAAR